MKKIHFTKKDIPLHVLILFGEWALASADMQIRAKMKNGRKGTHKFDEVFEKLDPMIDILHELAIHMDDSFRSSSSIKENELQGTILQITKFIALLRNIDNYEVQEMLDKIYNRIQLFRIGFDDQKFDEIKR